MEGVRNGEDMVDYWKRKRIGAGRRRGGARRRRTAVMQVPAFKLPGCSRVTGNPSIEISRCDLNFRVADNWSISPPHSIQEINALL